MHEFSTLPWDDIASGILVVLGVLGGTRGPLGRLTASVDEQRRAIGAVGLRLRRVEEHLGLAAPLNGSGRLEDTTANVRARP